MKTSKFKIYTQQIHQKTLQHKIRENLQKVKKKKKKFYTLFSYIN